MFIIHLYKWNFIKQSKTNGMKPVKKNKNKLNKKKTIKRVYQNYFRKNWINRIIFHAVVQNSVLLEKWSELLRNLERWYWRSKWYVNWKCILDHDCLTYGVIHEMRIFKWASTSQCILNWINEINAQRISKSCFLPSFFQRDCLIV